MSRPLRQLGTSARASVAMLLVLFSTSCTVTVYQPLASLQRPVVLDTKVANFEGLELLIRCVPGEDLDVSDSQLLCRQVSTLFRNQGANVEIDIPRNGRSLRDEKAPQPDLIVDLTARMLNRESSNVLTALSIMTLTLVPAVTEYSYAQDVSIRDPSGFLLASDSLQARFVEYFGAGIWSVNWVLDVAIRSDEEDLTGDAPKRDFSRDFYGQLSQLVLNAHVRSVVLRGFEADILPAPATATEGGQ